MELVNFSKKTVIAKEIETVSEFFKKTKGLMFRKSIGKDSAFLMKFDSEENRAIWMPFMKFSIDVLFLDSSGKVVGVFENARPIGKNPKTWKIYSCKVPADRIIELPAGKIKKTKTGPGDLIKIKADS